MTSKSQHIHLTAETDITLEVGESKLVMKLKSGKITLTGVNITSTGTNITSDASGHHLIKGGGSILTLDLLSSLHTIITFIFWFPRYASDVNAHEQHMRPTQIEPIDYHLMS